MSSPSGATARALLIGSWVDWMMRRTEVTGFVAPTEVVERAARAAAETIYRETFHEEPPQEDALITADEAIRRARIQILEGEVKLRELQLRELRQRGR